MVKITAELLRKRAEHNQGMLSNLQQVSLHQFDIDRIQNLDKLCKHLKILYLQNNVIPKMQNLSRLKELEYLNLAINNISKIQGVRSCESLRKLDLTLNFIDLPQLQESMINLSQLRSISQLYMTGNPCMDWEGCRAYIIATVPQLSQLDGKDITNTQRLQALQALPTLTQHLYFLIQNPQTKPTSYTKQSKIQMAQQSEKIRKQKQDRQKTEDEKQYGKPMEPASLYNHLGQIRQCNQGGYKFDLSQIEQRNIQIIILDLKVPRYLQTSQIDVDLNPTYVRITVRNKVTQLKFPCQILVQESKVQRSQTTGALQLRMPKLKNTGVPHYKLPDTPPIFSKPLPKPVQTSPIIQPERPILQTEPEEPWEDDDEVPPLE